MTDDRHNIFERVKATRIVGLFEQRLEYLRGLALVN
mgnify:CR=1 FL=1